MMTNDYTRAGVHGDMGAGYLPRIGVGGGKEAGGGGEGMEE